MYSVFSRLRPGWTLLVLALVEVKNFLVALVICFSNLSVFPNNIYLWVVIIRATQLTCWLSL